jgi:DNA invertase Pin-like site-specific DNA recombinase
MMTVVGGLAEFERDLISIRTSEGRVRAKANEQASVQGPNSLLTSSARRSSALTGDETLADIGRSYNVSHSTISRLTE